MSEWLVQDKAPICPICGAGYPTGSTHVCPTPVLTLYEPWATLVALGVKQIETRSWQTSYRWPIAIHVSRHYAPAERAESAYFQERGFFPIGYDDDIASDFVRTRGKIIATVDLVECTRYRSWQEVEDDMLLDLDQRAMGFFGPGRVGWFLQGAHVLPIPIAARGQRGLWVWTISPPI